MNNYWQFVPVTIPHLIAPENDNSFGNGFLFYQMEPIQGSLALNNFYFSGPPQQNPPIILEKPSKVDGEVSKVIKLKPRDSISNQGTTKIVEKVTLSKK